MPLFSRRPSASAPFALGLAGGPARGGSPARLIFLATFWMVALGNWPLWEQLARLPELANWRGVAFGLAFAVIIGGGIALLLALLAWRFTLKPALTLFLLAAAFGAYFMHTYGVVIDRSMMVNTLSTDSREVRDLLSWRMALVVGVLGLLPAVAVWRARLAWPGWPRQLLRNLGLALLSLALAVGALMLVFQDFASVMRNHTQLRYLINPLNSFYALATLVWEPGKRERGPVQPLGEDARLPALPPGAKPPLVVLVLGETARADHFALNGYPRPTTPELEKLGVASLRNVWSCGTNTAASVPCMFSPLSRGDFENRKTDTEGLADVLQRAGYAVLWIDNQAGGCKGVCQRVPTVRYHELSAPGLCSDGECFDEVMLYGLQARIDQLPAERRARGVVVFMHQMGSHGPAYYKRTPPQFKRFMPECASNALQQCGRQEVVNAFDNTILYTDHFLASVIGWLQQHEDHWAPAMSYASDHGESLGENGLYLHGLPYGIAPDEQKRPAWITWLSPGFQAETGITTACVQAKQDEEFSHDNYFHSMLGLLGVQTRVHEVPLDIFASCRKPR